MSNLIFNEQTVLPTAPASGKVKLWVDNTATPLLRMMDDGSAVSKILDNRHILNNQSSADQTGFSSDTYLSGSGILIPVGRLIAVGFQYKLTFDMVKTAAGTATPIIYIRFGTTGTTADTARLTFTFGAGTADADTGLFEVFLHFRTVGASAVAVGVARCTHHLAATGLISTGASGTGILIVTSGSFDSTVANSYIGASFNGGASFSGTNVLVQSAAYNLNVGV